MAVVLQYISFFGDKLTAQKLAKAVGDNLDLQIVTNTISKILKIELILGKNST